MFLDVGMNRLSTKRIAICVGLGLALFFGAAAIVLAHSVVETSLREKENSARLGAQAMSDFTQTSSPEFSEKSIAKALALYGIQLPRNVRGPFISKELEDRGVTIREGLNEKLVVYIGRDAFSSWALLGSTLGHEIEVHCRQNFLAIHLQNLAGFDGTGAAEREAYKYELSHAGRFGLNQDDREFIKNAAEYFYPQQQGFFVQKFMPVKIWLDRLSANAFIRNSL